MLGKTLFDMVILMHYPGCFSFFFIIYFEKHYFQNYTNIGKNKDFLHKDMTSIEVSLKALP